jgi:hypothetical protein
MGRYARLDLLCLDELGYVHLDLRGAELVFQITSGNKAKTDLDHAQQVRWRREHRLLEPGISTGGGGDGVGADQVHQVQGPLATVNRVDTADQPARYVAFSAPGPDPRIRP